jgi:hypothetical protein
MIIAYLGRNVKDYRENFLRNFEKLAVYCPQCTGKTVLHGCYDRHININENTEWIVIQRVICSKCRRTHAIMPDFIKPYKHYSAGDVEFALRDAEGGISAEKVETTASIPTVKRWVNEFIELGKQAVGGLKAILKNTFDKTINDIGIIGLKTFEILEYLLEKLPCIESSGLTIGEANQWLTNHIAGVYV